MFVSHLCPFWNANVRLYIYRYICAAVETLISVILSAIYISLRRFLFCFFLLYSHQPAPKIERRLYSSGVVFGPESNYEAGIVRMKNSATATHAAGEALAEKSGKTPAKQETK